MSIDRVNEFLHDLARWASSRKDILGAALVGSYARHEAKDTSDVDLVLIVVQPTLYLGESEWTQSFGAVRRRQIEDYGKLTSVRVWYVGGLEVEFGITDESWVAQPLDEGTRRVLSDGMQILYERANILTIARRTMRGP